ADRRGHRQRNGAASLPLRHLQSHPQGDPCRRGSGREDGEPVMSTEQTKISVDPYLPDYLQKLTADLTALPLSRRNFIKVTGFVGGGLVLGFTLGAAPRRAEAQTSGAAEFKPNAYIQIATDGRIVLY